jgi:hypothetical protein
MKINLMTQTIRGTNYGVGRCIVHVGPASTDAIAVSADDEKWISTEEDVICWLMTHKLTRHEARQLLKGGLQAWDEMQANDLSRIASK